MEYIPLWTALIGALAAIIVALAAVVPSVLAYKSLKASRVNALKIDAQGLQLEAGAAQTAELAKNIDGAMAEIKETIAAKNLAEGKLEGMASEQARVAEMPEPEQHHEPSPQAAAQLDKIETVVNETKEILGDKPIVRPEVRKQLDAIQEAVTKDAKPE